MPADSVVNCRRRCVAFIGFVCCLLFGSVAGLANNLPDDAPILISENKSTRALTARQIKQGFDMSARVFEPGANTKVTVFVTNLDLLPGEGANAFRADVEDARHFRYPLEVLSLEPLSDRPWVYALTFRLHNALGDVGDVLLRVAWRGMSSNRVRLAIGHEGDGLPDDENAAPTPMPTRPIVKTGEPDGFVGLPWSGDRVRFMQQAAFGPTPALEARLRRISLSTWLTEQMEEKRDANGNLRYSSIPYPTQAAVPPAVPDLPFMHTNIINSCGSNPTVQCQRDNYSMYKLQNWFYREAIYGEDQQLRRRVSWALHQIFVVSGRDIEQAARMLPYVQILDRHAFGNFRGLLKEITFNPAMGQYLDMAISTAQNPNENYAREILQLFSVGVDMLNPDGTPKLDQSGNRIPTYDQNTVNGFTKVFTGWSYNGTVRQNALDPNSPLVSNYRDPMVLTQANHDTGTKQLMVYPGASPTVIPAGLSADQDVDYALDNIFNHPNVGPFIGKLLIQQLVTSNPTPAYVKRVADAFNGEGPYGNGVRGEMKNVIRAILLDPEARGHVKTDPDYGKLREPVLYVTNMLRYFGARSQQTTATGVNCNGQSDGVINSVTLPLDQDVFNPPSVFNYYQMDYVIPNTNLAGPEFNIFSTGTALKRPNFINQFIPPNSTADGGLTIVTNQNAANYTPCGTRLNFARYQTLAQEDPTGNQLVDTLNQELLNGSMSGQMRNEILTAVQAVVQTNPIKRARTAIYLVASSPQYQVQR